MSATWAEVPLTKGYIAKVDRSDLPAVLAAGKWTASVMGRVVYARRRVTRPGGSQSSLYLHTFLTGWTFTDHINGDGLDCRRANLRPATKSQNNANRPAPRTNTTGYKGVSWNKFRGRYYAKITVRRRQLALGLYDDPAAAARAYDAAARHHFGEYACLNFPEDPQ